MTNLSKSTRALLDAHFVINHIAVDRQQRSSDQTIKNAIRLHDGLTVESVLIPTETRSTACVSSQVGCSLDCTFCATSQLKRMRNLNPDEIYDQVMALDRQSQLYFGRPLSNIVFMGMGEPLMNYKNVIAAVERITEGLGLSPKRITISTSGIPKMIEKLADENPRFQLAVSLHWYQQTRSKITFEYLIWKGINDAQEDIDALVAYCKRVPSKVNIIEYNPTDFGDFEAAEHKVIEAYKKALERARITVTVRRSRGKDIDAACGQLANKLIPLES
jgi:23S rRNA (adenine2503-C2)-methyltransferase